MMKSTDVREQFGLDYLLSGQTREEWLEKLLVEAIILLDQLLVSKDCLCCLENKVKALKTKFEERRTLNV